MQDIRRAVHGANHFIGEDGVIVISLNSMREHISGLEMCPGNDRDLSY